MDKVRCAVVNALVRQEAGGYCNLVLQSVLGQHSEFGPRDKSFLSAVFYGTVERQFTIDYLLQKCLNRPLEKLDAVVRAILRAGLYQARWMNGVPVRAAVYESVLLTKGMRKASASGLEMCIRDRDIFCVYWIKIFVRQCAFLTMFWKWDALKTDTLSRSGSHLT